MTQQEQFEADYLAAFPNKGIAGLEFHLQKHHGNRYTWQATRDAYEVWLQQAKRHEAELRTKAGVKMLAKYQSCGCQVCVCETEDRCLGCGAKNCGTHPAGEIPNPIYVAPLAQAVDVPSAQEFHSDDVAVQKFADAMKVKMAKQRAKGYGGWDDESQCPVERLRSALFESVAKGDPVDVGNFAMMLFNRDANEALRDANNTIAKYEVKK